MTPGRAPSAAARRRFGDVTRLKERGHDVRTLRRARKRRPRRPPHGPRPRAAAPGFALAVMLTLAIGIGANTAIFSVVDQLLLRPLPYPGGDRLVTGERDFPNVAKAIEVNSVSPANWLDWQRESRTFESLAAWRTATYTLTGVGAPMRIDAQLVSAEFFPLLGVRPLLGRTVTPDDDRPEAPRVVVLSHELWQGRIRRRRRRHRPRRADQRRADADRRRHAGRVPLRLPGHRRLDRLPPRSQPSVAQGGRPLHERRRAAPPRRDPGGVARRDGHDRRAAERGLRVQQERPAFG